MTKTEVKKWLKSKINEIRKGYYDRDFKQEEEDIFFPHMAGLLTEDERKSMEELMRAVDKAEPVVRRVCEKYKMSSYTFNNLACVNHWAELFNAPIMYMQKLGYKDQYTLERELEKLEERLISAITACPSAKSAIKMLEDEGLIVPEQFQEQKPLLPSAVHEDIQKLKELMGR